MWKAQPGASANTNLQRVMDWIETTDAILFGDEREKGVIREFREGEAFRRGAFWMFMSVGGTDFVLQLLRMIGVIK